MFLAGFHGDLGVSRKPVTSMIATCDILRVFLAPYDTIFTIHCEWMIGNQSWEVLKTQS
jgi:hypothetical protein